MGNSGIYQIRNLIDDKIYVGRASFLDKRKWEHYRTLRYNKHSNIYLQNAYNKYGVSFFVFEILEECNKDMLISREHHWCKKLNCNNPKIGYNLAITHPTIGFYKHSDETKLKISNALKGKKRSEEAIRRMRATKIGCKLSENHKNKIKEWHKNNDHPMLKGHSLEAKRKMSASRKGCKSNHRKKINSYCLTTGERIVFDSLSEASLYFSIGVTSISNNLHNRSKVVMYGKNKIKFNYE